MTDADRYHAHGPLQPMPPDDWHDRPRRGTLRAVVLLALAIFILALVTP